MTDPTYLIREERKMTMQDFEKKVETIRRVWEALDYFEEVANSNLNEYHRHGSPERHSRHFAFYQAARHLREVLENE